MVARPMKIVVLPAGQPQWLQPQQPPPARYWKATPMRRRPSTPKPSLRLRCRAGLTRWPIVRKEMADVRPFTRSIGSAFSGRWLSVPLPATVDVSRCSRVTADLYRNALFCGIAKAVSDWSWGGCKDLRAKLFRESAREAGCRVTCVLFIKSGNGPIRRMTKWR